MTPEDEEWIKAACDADAQPGTTKYLARRLITSEEAIEVYEAGEDQ